jgi:hypothetical protein
VQCITIDSTFVLPELEYIKRRKSKIVKYYFEYERNKFIVNILFDGQPSIYDYRVKINDISNIKFRMVLVMGGAATGAVFRYIVGFLGAYITVDESHRTLILELLCSGLWRVPFALIGEYSARFR